MVNFSALLIRTFLICIASFSLALNSNAKLNASTVQNIAQWGQPIDINEFPSKLGFTGYVTYNINQDWKLKAFFINNKVRREHLIPQEGQSPKLSRNEVREWAKKMFAIPLRGSYKKKITYPRVEGYFFDKGLIAYEHKNEGKKHVGYQGVKVLLYERDQSFYKINPKAYL